MADDTTEDFDAATKRRAEYTKLRSEVSLCAATPTTAKENCIKQYAGKMMRSEIARANGQLATDFVKILEGHCIYLPGFFCKSTDFTLFERLTRDLEEETQGSMINWSKHLKHDSPDFSPTFQEVLRLLESYFDVEIYATRLNFYRDGTDWKPYHHDSHAYGGKGKREDFTMGASFGGSRALSFFHEPSGETFAFPQQNGDVFAFTTTANKRFKHGVPKLTSGRGAPRFSIIAWGRRNVLNERNSADAEVREEEYERWVDEDSDEQENRAPHGATTPDAPARVNERVDVDMNAVRAALPKKKEVKGKKAKGGGTGKKGEARRKSRLQGRY